MLTISMVLLTRLLDSILRYLWGRIGKLLQKVSPLTELLFLAISTSVCRIMPLEDVCIIWMNPCKTLKLNNLQPRPAMYILTNSFLSVGTLVPNLSNAKTHSHRSRLVRSYLLLAVIIYHRFPPPQILPSSHFSLQSEILNILQLCPKFTSFANISY